jgi:hypothetical protein
MLFEASAQVRRDSNVQGAAVWTRENINDRLSRHGA